MKLISPYTFPEVNATNSIALSSLDITEFLDELPDDAIRCTNLIHQSGSTFLARFINPVPRNYNFKTIFFLNDNKIVGILNETTRQQVTCNTLGIKITLVRTEDGNKDLSALIRISPFLNDNNPYYKPTELKDLITTREEAEEENNGVVIPGLIVQKNIPYTSILINQYFPVTNKLVLMPNYIDRTPILGIITGEAGLEDEYWIDYDERKSYGTSNIKLRGLINEQVASDNLLGFYDAYGNDRLYGGHSERLTNKFFYCINRGSDILWISKNEEIIFGQSYDIINRGFGNDKDLFSSTVRRFLFRDYLIVFDLQSHQGMIYKLSTGHIIYFQNYSDSFYLIPNGDTPLLFVDVASKDKEGTIRIAESCWIDGEGVIISRNDIEFHMFSQKYLLKDKHIIIKLNE